MPFLLLLSALLTALTGVVTGVRPLEISAHCPAAATSVDAAAVVTIPSVAGHVHLLGTFGGVPSFALGAAVSVMRTCAPRLYLDRLRA